MKEWSDSPVHEKFAIKFFVDTNLLIYLVDNTFQSLNEFIEILNDSGFARVVSSKYVIFEFVGARKREHYLRIAAENSKKTPNGQINFGSLYKYRDSYNAPNAVFEESIEKIQKEVKAELEKIARDHSINFEYSSLHEDQLQPTFDVCLTSKISNQDSLVLVSSVLPQSKKTDSVILLTNDSTFVSSFANGNVKDTLAQHSISIPQILAIDNIPNNIRLTDQTERAILEERTRSFLGSLITSKLNSLYLGTTFTPDNANFPLNCICFKLVESYNLSQNVYVTIISKNLDFIYTTKSRVASFWHNGEALAHGFISPNDQKINVSCKVQTLDDGGNEADLPQGVMTELKAEGNLVFIHPDSIVN